MIRETRGQGPTDEGAAGGLIRHVVRADHDLAIGDLAQRAGILASHPNRARPLLGQPGVVEAQESCGRALCHQCLHPLLIQGLRVPGRIRTLSVDGDARLLAHCGPQLSPLVLTALHTGFRKSQLLSLTWNVIDLGRCVITVQAAYAKSG